MCRHGDRMQAEGGGRKAHRALRLRVEGAVLARALRQEQGKNYVEREPKEERSTDITAPARRMESPVGATTRGRARGFCVNVW